MSQIGIQTHPGISDRWLPLAKQTAIVVGASAVIAVCARLVLPLPFTPVPLTLGNFGVLLVGLSLGSKRGFAAAALYLSWGAMGLPVFSPAGVGGLAQLFGPTGGYLLAYPVVAFLAGWLAERGTASFARNILAGDGRRSCPLRFRNRLAANRHGKLAEGLRLRPRAIPVRRSHQNHVCRCRSPQAPAFDIVQDLLRCAHEPCSKFSGVTARPI